MGRTRRVISALDFDHGVLDGSLQSAFRPVPSAFYHPCAGRFVFAESGLYLLRSFHQQPVFASDPAYARRWGGFESALQDFGLIVHPPLLYAGYVGLAIPFALAVAALLRGVWMRPGHDGVVHGPTWRGPC